MNLFRLSLIIGTLPNTLTNGTVADATQVMADFNKIVNDVNANAAPLSNTALLNANNNFTAVQSGIGAQVGANFPIASQVQNWAFNTLTSTLGTNTLTARIAALSLSAYETGQVFTFIPSQGNTGAVGITIDAAGSSSLFSQGVSLGGGELGRGVPAMIERDAAKFNLMTPPVGALARAWGFVAAPTTVNSSFPFTGVSVVKNSAGNYTVTHGVTFATSNYSVISSCEKATAVISQIGTRTTTSITLLFFDAGGVAVDPDIIHYVCFGYT